MQFHRNTQELGKFANSCGNRNCGLVFPQLFSSSQRGNSLLHTVNKAWLLANENAVTCQIYCPRSNERLVNHWFKLPLRKTERILTVFLWQFYFKFWGIMASASFMPVLFCILFISCWLVQTESFSSNGVGKRAFKVNIYCWVFYVQVSLNVRRASLCWSFK